MNKFFASIVATIFLTAAAGAQFKIQPGLWRAQLQREDGNNIVFTFNVSYKAAKPIVTVINDAEKIAVTDISFSNDSVFIKMPVFESQFRAKILHANTLAGKWIKATATKTVVVPFVATTTQPYRFKNGTESTDKNISGKWSITFTNAANEAERAIGEFTQTSKKLSGSVLTSTGDYRYLDGIVKNDSLFLSTFDGVHAFLCTAKIYSNDSIGNGMFYSSATGKQQWSAVKNDTATLPDDAAMFLKDSADAKLDFSFTDITGKKVSLNDARFKNKVVIIQLMGSWCPNCMDETAFLSDYYKQNKKRGIEIIALAYELSTDFKRSQTYLKKFQQKFDVQYPMLVTGVTVIDPQRTEKTLPQLTQIKSFPSSIFLDKTGKVRKISTDFFGPGTGEYYTKFKTEFNNTIDALLAEPVAYR